MSLTEKTISFNPTYNGMELTPILQYIHGSSFHAKQRKPQEKIKTLLKIKILAIEITVGFLSFIKFITILLKKNKIFSLYVSSMNNQSYIDGYYVDRVIDPLIEDTDKEFLKIGFSRFYKSGKKKYGYAFNITYLIYSATIFFFIKNILFKKSIFHNIYCSIKSNNLCEISFFRFIKIMSILESGICIYTLLLQKKHIESLYVSNAYSLDTASGIYAANKLHINTHCIQHGVQHPNHYAFNFLHPFNTLPKKYLVWNESSIGLITQFACVEIIGFKWSSYVLKNTSFDIVKEITNNYNNVVLVTTQPTTGIISEEIIKLIERSTTTFFLYRLHPSQNNIESHLILKRHLAGLKNIEIEYATNAPLPILLAHANYHITGFSSCVIEAVNQNCKTIVYHPKATEYYPELIANNCIDYKNISEIFFP